MDKVTELSLAGQNLKRFPAAVRKLSKLESLLLAGNNFADLPEWLTELPLKRLDYSGNKLSQVPSIVRKLERLEWLKLGEDPLEELPDFLSEMPELASLFLMGINKLVLTTLPKSFAQSSLKELDLYGCRRFTTVPEVIQQMSKLRRLQLNWLKLSELPNWLGDLPLQELSLGKMPLTLLPDSLYQMQLEALSLSDLDELGVPTQLGSMKHLKRLTIQPGMVKSGEQVVPASLGELTQLEELHLVNIEFDSPPAWLSKFKQLRRLYLPATKFTEPPRVLAELPKLEWINLRYAPQLKGREAEVKALVPNAELIMPT
ncbi:MAG: leucine-rich repeat domain-containing protein [Polyangiaceae bacterium]